jgi:hypothetical protein
LDWRPTDASDSPLPASGWFINHHSLQNWPLRTKGFCTPCGQRMIQVTHIVLFLLSALFAWAPKSKGGCSQTKRVLSRGTERISFVFFSECASRSEAKLFGWFHRKQRSAGCRAQGFRLQLCQATRYGRRIITEPRSFIHSDCAEGAKETIEPEEGNSARTMVELTILVERPRCLRFPGVPAQSRDHRRPVPPVSARRRLHANIAFLFAKPQRRPLDCTYLSVSYHRISGLEYFPDGVIRSVAVNTSRLPAKASRRRKKEDESSNSSTPCRD